MTVFLRLHFDLVLESDTLMYALKEWKRHQAEEADRLNGLVGYCGGVVSFLRSPRT
jgi:U3 small nucleolar RNA-associated protein 21